MIKKNGGPGIQSSDRLCILMPSSALLLHAVAPVFLRPSCISIFWIYEKNKSLSHRYHSISCAEHVFPYKI